MRILFSILFISLLMSKLVYGLFWQVKFQLFQKEIIAIECENKDRPEMNCNGKCYLAKQFKKIDDDLEKKKEEKNKTESNLKNLKNSEYQHQILDFQFNPFEIDLNVQKSSFHFEEHYNFCYFTSVFHPPSLI